MPKIAIINSKHKKTLAAIFAKPDASNIKFADIEALVVALGGEVTEGDGSRVAMHLHGGVNHAHRPPPGQGSQAIPDQRNARLVAGGRSEAMNSTLTHKGLTARVEFDADEGILWGKVLGMPDQVSITFEGQTVQELRQDFERAVDFYLKECERTGTEPLKPASGKLMLRVAPEVHSAALIAAQAAGVSLNQWAARVLSQAAHH